MDGDFTPGTFQEMDPMAMCDFPSFLFCLGWDGVATLGWPKGYMHAKLLQSCPTLCGKECEERVSGSKLKRWCLGTMKKLFQKVEKLGASLVGQWLRFHTINAGSPGSVPSQRTRSLMLQLKILNAARKIKDSACQN